MQKKLIMILLLLFPIIAIAQNQYVTAVEAELAAITRVKVLSSSKEAKVVKIACLKNEKNDVLLYEVETDNGLTVLLSGSKACQPILAVHNSEEDLYLQKYDVLPCGIRFLIDCYKEQVDSCFHDRGVTLHYQDAWHDLVHGEIGASPKTRNVSPLLSSNWMQRLPNDLVNVDAYNYLMPGSDSCSHCLAGCVAVAMGQVMYYWKYPVLVKNREIQLDWCSMADNLYTNSPTFNENRNAISYLLKECGFAVNMNYGCGGSSASTAIVRDALVDEFGYNSSAEYKDRLWFSDNDWKDMLKNNLDNGRPVIYRGRNALIGGEGHAFVCDGYNENGEFHFNWGWHQSYNSSSAYFTLNHLTPGTYNFSFRQGAIFDILPMYAQQWCNINLYLDDFYGEHETHGHPLHTATPSTMTKLISASSAAPLSWRTIPAGATAMYQAHEEIVLQDGFTVEAGAEFTAEIVPCPNCEGSRDATGNVDGVAADEPAEIMAPSRRTPEPPQPQADLYPNPTSGEVTVSVEGEVQSVVILNMMGQPVGGWGLRAMEPGRVTIDVGPLPAGPYLVCVYTPHGTATKKLLVGTE